MEKTSMMTALEVLVQDTGETIRFLMSNADAQRAATDSVFAKHMVDKEYERRSLLTIQAMNSAEQNAAILKEHVPSGPVSPTERLSLAPSPSPVGHASPVESLSSVHSPSYVGEENGADKCQFMWPPQCLSLLLAKYEERMADFTGGAQRHSKIWQRIAADMNIVNPKCEVSGTQCQSKMSGLKKMYKKIIDHNSVSGNDRKSWQYYERMHELLGKSGWAAPKAIASEMDSQTVDLSCNVSEAPVAKKLKMESVVDKAMKTIHQQKEERERKKTEERAAMFAQVQEQRERQHLQKLDVMKKLAEAMTGKKLFD